MVVRGWIVVSCWDVDGMYWDVEVFLRFGLGVRGDDNVNNFCKFVRSVVRVGGE